MTNAEILYTYRSAYPDFLQRGRNNTVSMPVYRDAALVAPSAATLTLYSPDHTPILDSVTATITGSVATYTILAASLPSTLDLGEGYLERWVLTLGGVPITVDREAALARVQLAPVITDLDLMARYPDLAALRGVSLVSFQGFIDESWKMIVSRLLGQGVLPYLVISREAFRGPNMELALALIFQWASKNQQNRGNYLELSTTHRQHYETAWGSLNFRTDADQDGHVDDPYRRDHPLGQVVHRSASPSARYYPSRDRRW